MFANLIASKPVVHGIAAGILLHRAAKATPDAINRAIAATQQAYSVALADAAEYAARKAAEYAADARARAEVQAAVEACAE